MDRIGPRRLLPGAAAVVGIGALLFATGQTQLDGAGYASLSDAGRDLVQELIQSGHFNLALPDEEE